LNVVLAEFTLYGEITR